MARDITTGFSEEITASQMNLCLFVKMEFESSDVNVWSGYGTKTFNGDDYTGIGNLGGIDQIKEKRSLSAEGVVLTLSSIPSSYISLALTENYQNKPVYIWLGVLDQVDEIIGSPLLLFSGLMNIMKISEDGESGTISVECESTCISLKTKKERRFTSEDQKAEFPDDLGLDFVATIQDQEIRWGS